MTPQKTPATQPGDLALVSLTPIVMACFTLGLAPFFPEPHIWGKLKWVAGGAVGMAPIDWGDMLMHGAPWVFLVGALVRLAVVRVRAAAKASAPAR